MSGILSEEITWAKSVAKVEQQQYKMIRRSAPKTKTNNKSQSFQVQIFFMPVTGLWFH